MRLNAVHVLVGYALEEEEEGDKRAQEGEIMWLSFTYTCIVYLNYNFTYTCIV